MEIAWGGGRRPNGHDRRDQRINPQFCRAMAFAFVDRNVSSAIGDRDGIGDRVVEQRMIAVNELTRVRHLGEIRRALGDGERTLPVLL